MRIAIISDIHGNLIAYNSVIRDLQDRNIDKIICLGDCITDGPNTNKIIETLKRDCDIIIEGNREGYIKNIEKYNDNLIQFRSINETEKSLTSKNKDYISSLDGSKIIKVGKFKILLIHGNEFTPNSLKNNEVYEQLCQKYEFDICLFGHTHIQSLEKYNKKIFLNPGSCGMPADGPCYKYCILEINDNKYNIEQVKLNTLDTFSEYINYIMTSNMYSKVQIWLNLCILSVHDGYDYFGEFLSQFSKIINEHDTVDAKNTKYINLYNKMYSSKFDEVIDQNNKSTIRKKIYTK